MKLRRHPGPGPVLSRLASLPGVDEVVWSILASSADARLPLRLAFVAAEKGAGTSTMAAAAAAGLVQHERVPVCLLEANVERPGVARYLGLEGPGLSDVLDGRATLSECLQEAPDCPGLRVLPAGTARTLAPGEFTVVGLHAIVDELGRHGSYVVLDAPPLLAHLEARRLLQYADAALLILRAGATRRDDATSAQRILLEARVPLIGSVFNASRMKHVPPRSQLLERLWPRATLADEPQHAEPRFARAPLAAAIADVDAQTAPAPNGALEPAAAVAGGPSDARLDARREQEYRMRIDLLERRVAKLNHLLAQTEESLRRVAALKDVDPGIASIYRGVQGLSPDEDALGFKRKLMQEIFQANLELKAAITRST